MKVVALHPIACCFFLAWSPCVAETKGEFIEQIEFESLPDEFVARLEQIQREAVSVPKEDENDIGAGAVIELLKRWDPGQTITVAFKGGSKDLHKKIADTAAEWTQFANLKFDFGLDGNGDYRTWSTNDKEYKADIRISFDKKGYWSLIGTDARNSAVVKPGEASMNFGGFSEGLPNSWASTVLHEFGHAIAAKHEHQHPTQGCETDYRWDDDTGYKPTKDKNGAYIDDAKGLRPGIYTVMSGPPNEWPKSKVDWNMRQLKDEKAYDFGDFDKLSIMKYYQPSWMYKTGQKSQCWTGSKNIKLSSEDKKRISVNYPKDPASVADIMNFRRGAVANALPKLKDFPLVERSINLYQAPK